MEKQRQPRRKFYDLKDRSFEYRVKRFSLFVGTHSIPQMLYRAKQNEKYKDLQTYIENNQEQVQTWMDELRTEVLDAYFSDESLNHTREEKNAIHNYFQNKYQVDIR